MRVGFERAYIIIVTGDEKRQEAMDAGRDMTIRPAEGIQGKDTQLGSQNGNCKIPVSAEAKFRQRSSITRNNARSTFREWEREDISCPASLPDTKSAPLPLYHGASISEK